MILTEIDLERGRGTIGVIVDDFAAADAFQQFIRDATASIRDAERWREIERLMQYKMATERWELNATLDWCPTPAEAVDAAILRRQNGETK